MNKRENILVVDVETCGGFGSSLVYDLGFAVVERATGRIIEAHSLVISDVFYDMPEKMESAYYAAKLPMYHDGIAAGAFKVVNLWEAWRLVRDTIAKYNIRRVYAYNAGFDKDALNFTMRTITAGKFHNFMPRGVKWSCIMHMACQTLFSQPSYLRFAEANGLVTEKGNLRTGAEAAYAYITRTPDFEESHTGLADVEIEVAILHKILRQKKRMNEKIVSNAWMIPQKAHKARRASSKGLGFAPRCCQTVNRKGIIMKVYVVWSGMLYDGCRIIEGIYFDEMKAQRWADMCFGTVEAVETSDNL